MAEAIKTISVARGYDVTRYALNCFGGAGGQHACDVADALAITTVLIHPFSSLLSAYGMGLADIAAQRAQGVDEPLRIDALVRVAAIVDRLSGAAVAEVEGQGVAREAIKVSSPRAAALFGLGYDDRSCALDACGDAARLRERAQEPLRLHRSQQGDRHRSRVGRGGRRRRAAGRADLCSRGRPLGRAPTDVRKDARLSSTGYGARLQPARATRFFSHGAGERRMSFCVRRLTSAPPSMGRRSSSSRIRRSSSNRAGAPRSRRKTMW